jgi:hypothetical protein
LISVYRTSELISISKSEFGSIYIGGNTSGGILYVEIGKSLNFSDCTFENIGTSWNGGILFISSCVESILISSCNFLNISSSGEGGAIYFGEDTSFSVSSCKFGFCVAGGYGGGIASNSTKEGDRLLLNDVFEENTGNGGNDYCDVSESVFSIMYYNSTSISGVLSLSLSPSFFYNYVGASMDCILSGDCVQNLVVGMETGVDAMFCGTSNFPCKSLGYILAKVLQNGGYVILNSGNYSMNNTQISKDFSITGNSSGTSTYPIIFTNSSTNGVLFNGANRVFYLSYLKFLHSSTSAL